MLCVMASLRATLSSSEYLESLIEFCQTENQEQIVRAVIEADGNVAQAAKDADIGERWMRRVLAKIRKTASQRGHAPGHWDDGTAPGYRMGKVTVQRSKGEVERVWERQHPDAARVEEFVEAMCQTVPRYKCPNFKKDRETDIIPWFQIGDAHLGMLAHEAETGANFDLKIAQRELCEAISLLIEETGEHERCVINDLGDFTHYENMRGETEASGHALDYDGRFPKMIDAYTLVMQYIIERALEKFNHVDVIINQGNHSRTNDIWMRRFLDAKYGSTGRVHVLDNTNIYIGYRMGNTFVLTNHSDKCKPQHLAGVMATDFRKDWGETEYHYIDIGHIHHKMTSKEHPGVMVESFNILANRDKYAHDAGYRSRQSITVIDRSRSYGELGRRMLPIQKVRDSIRAKCEKAGEAAPYEPQPMRAYAV